MTEKLPVILTADERAVRASELAQVVEDHDRAKAVAKAAAAEHKGKLDLLAAQRGELARVVRSGTELRDVETHETPDLARACWETTRLDTGEVIRTRRMTTEEAFDLRQQTLPQVGDRSRKPKGA